MIASDQDGPRIEDVGSNLTGIPVPAWDAPGSYKATLITRVV